MQVKAFSRLPDEKLVIVGSYEHSRHFKEYVSYINKIKPKNVFELAIVLLTNLLLDSMLDLSLELCIILNDRYKVNFLTKVTLRKYYELWIFTNETF